MKASKKLIGASVALVAALAVSVGSTFAWFTTNSNVSVSNIAANVTTGDSNLEVALVSVKGVTGLIGDFSYNLDLGKTIENGGLKEVFAATKFDALTDNGALNKGDNESLADWSWDGPTTFGQNLTDKKGTAAKLSTISSSTTDGDAPTTTYSATTGNYLQFTLRFRTTSSTAGSEGVALYFAPESAVTSTAGATHSDLVAQENMSDYGITAGKAMTAEAKDAMRIAFHAAKVTVPATTTSNDGKVEWANVGGDEGKVWEPNYDKGWNATSVTASKKFSQAVEESLTGIDDLSGLYTSPTYNAVTTVAADEVQIATMTKSEGSDYYIADVTVVIWLEGTDADCLNSIFGDLLNIKLCFNVESNDD